MWTIPNPFFFFKRINTKTDAEKINIFVGTFLSGLTSDLICKDGTPYVL